MRIIAKISIILILVVVVLFFCAYLIFNMRGRDIVEQQMARVFDVSVSLEDISLSFPATVKIKNLEIEGFLKTDLKFSVNPLGLFSAKIILNNIIVTKPQLTLKRGRDGVFETPLRQDVSNGKSRPLPIILGLDINDGHILFIDSSQNNYQLNIYDLDVRVHKKAMALRPAFNFDISAQLGDNAKNGKNFITTGWIDFIKKDMQGSLEIKDFYTGDISLFYNRLLGNGISESRLSLQAAMNAKDNDLKIDCHLLLSRIKPETEGETAGESKNHKDILVFSGLFDIFSSPEGEIELDFVIRTKLDKPKFDRIDFGASLFKTATKNILSKPQKEITSTVEEIGKDIEEWGKDKGKEILGPEGLKDIIDIFGK